MTSCSRSRFITLGAVLIVSVVLTGGTAAFAKPPGPSGNASFPAQDNSWSLDARFVVKNVDTPEDPDAPHSIFLTDMKTGERTLLYKYGRKVDLLWSPASDALAINDWDARDEAQCIVFPALPSNEKIDLREQFLKSRRPDREKRLAADRRDYSHNYAHIIQWVNAKTLLFAIEGRNSANTRSFRLDYAYTLGDSFRLINRTVR